MTKVFNVQSLSERLSVCGQLAPEDAPQIAELGFKQVICNRPDGEAEDQPASAEVDAALAELGIAFHRIYVPTSGVRDSAVEQFEALLPTLAGPTLAYCRSGIRSATLWATSQVKHTPIDAVLAKVQAAGFNVESIRARLQRDSNVTPKEAVSSADCHDVVIVGGGAGGIAAASSLLKRKPKLDIAVIEPAGEHYYQPGWTLVGAGVFKPRQVVRTMFSVMPRGVTWIREAVTEFLPEENAVRLRDGRRVHYKTLVAAPGIKLDWEVVEGLSESLGVNGVTSNYDFHCAPYTWELVRNLRSGRAVFTQPPMPIKCAGAPQKAMYLSCNRWEQMGCLSDIDVQFHNAGGVLFGVPDYVPALETYVKRYGAHMNFNESLVAVDGVAKKAWFDVGAAQQREVEFDFLHVSPPQTTPDFVRNSALVNDAGWIDVDQHSLQHTRYANVFALGDACSAPNAKTAAAVRKQAPVVAENALSYLANEPLTAVYDGYGSCPLTVERGKVVLAEFGYGGELQPTAPTWLLNGTEPTRMGWILKADLLPAIYFQLMLKGREWFAAPRKRSLPGHGNGPSAVPVSGGGVP